MVMASTQTEASKSSAKHDDRGPLRAIVLSSTGQDLAECSYCDLCEKYQSDGMDLTIGELIRGAKQNDLRVLSSSTLWLADEWIEKSMHCQSGLELSSILLTLQREAVERGLAPAVDEAGDNSRRTGAKSG
jgi:hypothetical protein